MPRPFKIGHISRRDVKLTIDHLMSIAMRLGNFIARHNFHEGFLSDEEVDTLGPPQVVQLLQGTGLLL